MLEHIQVAEVVDTPVAAVGRLPVAVAGRPQVEVAGRLHPVAGMHLELVHLVDKVVVSLGIAVVPC